MKNMYFFPVVIALLVLGITSCGTKKDDETAQVKQRAESFAEALNNRDINAIVEYWSDDAVYKNPITGNMVQGKNEIRKEYNKIFSGLWDAEIEMDTKSISFPFDDKAIEEGTARLKQRGRQPVESEYQIVYVKRNGNWYILNVSQLDLGILRNSRRR